MFDPHKEALKDLQGMARKMKGQKFMKVSVAGDSPEGVKAGLDMAKAKMDEEGDEGGNPEVKTTPKSLHNPEDVTAGKANPKLVSLVAGLSDADKMQLCAMLHAEHESKESPEFEAGEHAHDMD